ncbi:hypothetical protein [Dyella sp.]|uniref:hypothetical protein n=1 Tax=Dyella sp. TaxID=1869338 RepID=UPI00284803B9|nr:hypothetical protein [Dyella sp.]MDR3446852.1 hypothetical protein [Dyella sp.]
MRRSALFVLAIGALIVSSLQARDVTKVAEASMLVTGSVELNTDGSVHGYTLDHQEKIPSAVVDLIQRNVPTWRFTFSNPPTSMSKETMSLRVVAKNVDEHHTTLSLAAVQLDDAASTPSDHVHSTDQKPVPVFPAFSLKDRISGSVYLLVKVGRDGKVMDIATEQVNLRKEYEQTNMELYRKDLAEAAEKAVRQWTFAVPTTGKSVQAPSWLVRVPVNFHIANGNYDPNSGYDYGSWEIYIPGPRKSVSWLTDKRLLAEAPDATPAGTIHQLDSAPQLAP